MSDFLHFLGVLTRHMDNVMADEGIDAGVRQRVINRLTLGTPEPDKNEPDWPSTFGELKPGAVWMPMHDDSNSGPGWPLTELEEEERKPNFPAVNSSNVEASQ